MTTLEIYKSINIEELRKKQELEDAGKDEFFVIKLTDNQLLDSEFYLRILEKIKSVSKMVDTIETRKGVALSHSYYFQIINEELLNSLRQLYISTKNNFIKEVIKTVGQNKRMTEKQAEIIVDEMMKININLNF